MQEAKLLLKQDLKLLFTNAMWMFYNIAFPFLLILIMGSLCANLFGEEVSAYDYYGIAFLIYSAINAATIAANSFMEETIKAGNMRVLYAPVYHPLLYISKILASTLFCFVCHMVVALLCVAVLQMRVGTMWGLLVLLMLCGELFASTLGIYMCLLFQKESAANQILSIVINLSALLGGIFIAMERFGTFFSTISWISPMKWMLQAAFTCIYDGNKEVVILIAVILLFATLVLFVLCKLRFHEEECICSL